MPSGPHRVGRRFAPYKRFCRRQKPWRRADLLRPSMCNAFGAPAGWHIRWGGQEKDAESGHGAAADGGIHGCPQAGRVSKEKPSPAGGRCPRRGRMRGIPRRPLISRPAAASFPRRGKPCIRRTRPGFCFRTEAGSGSQAGRERIHRYSSRVRRNTWRIN